MMSSKEFDSTVCTLRFIEAKDKIEISAHDKGAKPKRYASGDNIICYICVTAETGSPERGGYTKTLRDIQERYEMYKNATKTLQDVQERYERYKNTAMHKNATRCSRTLLCCYVRERFEYDNDLSERLPVINDTSYDT